MCTMTTTSWTMDTDTWGASTSTMAIAGTTTSCATTGTWSGAEVILVADDTFQGTEADGGVYSYTKGDEFPLGIYVDSAGNFAVDKLNITSLGMNANVYTNGHDHSWKIRVRDASNTICDSEPFKFSDP